jgi:DNA polymerase epsilon subunit 2
MQGKFHLEDPTGTIELDLSTTKFHTGLFTENCVVLVEGTYTTAKRLVATNIGMPPVERADSTRIFLGGTDGANMFGGKSMTHLSAKLRHYEHIHDEVMLVFAADVCLDRSDVSARQLLCTHTLSAQVLTALRTLFTGYARQPPLAFVFMGDFCSPQQATGGAEQCQALKGLWSCCASIMEYPRSCRRLQSIGGYCVRIRKHSLSFALCVRAQLQ